ncbi:MAG: hypothetical protein A3K09_01705 [Nitrospinae bacterium RIFCSPLOWO2_12_FULL_47_7]|nr:MAG: hypothetical protein A3K09_01705 [Nitrospinae bacterium RIFCSPLOWO2_12_FULL_47_7]
MLNHWYIPEFASIIGTGLGGFLFYDGFRKLWLKRLIEDTPTGKIATSAVGANVEIKGVVTCGRGQMVFTPISQKPCAFYLLEIYKLSDDLDPEKRNIGLDKSKKIDSFFSSEGFFITDASGAKALVLPAGADVKWEAFPCPEFTINSSGFAVMPPVLKNALVEHSSSLKNFKLTPDSMFFRHHNYRFVEISLSPGDPVYVLGYADTGTSALRQIKLSFKRFLEAKKTIESDPALQKRFDANQDGVLNENELEQGARIIGEHREAQECLQAAPEADSPVKMVFRKHAAHPLIISTIKVEYLLFSLAWSSVFKLAGGALLAVASAVCLLYLLSP